MNPELIRYYSEELQHVREMGGEFAKEYPKVAARLGLESLECADPYVERLLEGFSFLAARVQMKIDAEFPRFTQHLAELVYPHYLAPTPSMAVVQIRPDLSNPGLAEGVKIPRGSAFRSLLDKNGSTRCEYRSAHDLTLWPLEIAEAKFFTHSGSPGGADIALPPGVKAGLRLRLRATCGLKISQLKLDRLVLYLRGTDALPTRIYERLLGSVAGVLVMPVSRAATWHAQLPRTAVAPVGFAEDEALLPIGKQSFQGYRLLQEYFAFAQRFMFVAIEGLQPALRRCGDNEVEVIVLLERGDPMLEQTLDASNFALFCTPLINLFPRRTDRIALSSEQFEYHVVADRTRPMDFEIYRIEEVTGYGAGAAAEQTFEAFYHAHDLGAGHGANAYYQVRREKRLRSSRQAERGPRTSYLGSETFIALVDAANAPFRGDLRQLGLQALCTNRDLPLMLSMGSGQSDFTLDVEAPVDGVRCVSGPSRPLPSYAHGAVAWRLLSHLSLNYASLVDSGAKEGASALRDLLSLYCPVGDPATQRMIEGVRSVDSHPVTRRLPFAGPIVFGRGLAITLTLDEAAFEGAGAFLLGAVLSHYFAQYVSINSFAETVVKTLSRGEIMRWPARGGQCRTL
ncbi:type VI secretion system baseplate subunit TssF [Paraburkholderia sp. LEh10]|uniref:type VI secretion system baseplate subunit TssF n=1 Tax=Paraburkholderia sp. LEh10 TaxID=2821353 RepID=UPI001AE5862F|nr:type VI secretion system baseplate subunit TssF [Paraburkholderia sp. LEh10]MBP0593959.1 type VI secretion system baseplate subunit TssF [Paraburkholderia sp. LEh10]